MSKQIHLNIPLHHGECLYVFHSIITQIGINLHLRIYPMNQQILNPRHIVVYPLDGDTRNLCAGVHYWIPIQEFIKEQHTHLIIYNDINDDLAQGIMIITMLLNDILKGIDNSSLDPRVLICIDSKLQSMPWILVTLQKKI